MTLSILSCPGPGLGAGGAPSRAAGLGPVPPHLSSNVCCSLSSLHSPCPSFDNQMFSSSTPRPGRGAPSAARLSGPVSLGVPPAPLCCSTCTVIGSFCFIVFSPVFSVPAACSAMLKSSGSALKPAAVRVVVVRVRRPRAAGRRPTPIHPGASEPRACEPQASSRRLYFVYC